jgi:hypothetical protein
MHHTGYDQLHRTASRPGRAGCPAALLCTPAPARRTAMRRAARSAAATPAHHVRRAEPARGRRAAPRRSPRARHCGALHQAGTARARSPRCTAPAGHAAPCCKRAPARRAGRAGSPTAELGQLARLAPSQMARRLYPCPN